MAARPRDHGNKSLPNNLYRRTRRGTVYYEYRNPVTGKTFGLGSDKARAEADAIHANAIIAQEAASARARKLLRQVDAIRWGDWLDTYIERQEELVSEGEIAPATLASRKSMCNALRGLGDVMLAEVTTKMIAGLVGKLTRSGKRRMAQMVRTRAVDVFRHAQACGHYPAGVNPAEVAEKVKTKVKRQRLTVEDWRAMAKHHALIPAREWHAIQLGLVTGLRLETVRELRWKDVRDGYLHVGSVKGGHRLRLSLGLGVEGMTLGGVLKSCRDGVLSAYVLHHPRSVGRTKAGDPLRNKSIGEAFRTLRAAAGITGDNPPSYHELRSLAKRLYAEQGIDILRHKTAKMEATYADTRGAEWETVGG